MKNMMNNWHYPTAIRFGAGRLNELTSFCDELAIKRPLLVTDPGLCETPMVEKAVGLTEALIFSDFKSNPTGSQVDAGVQAYLKGQHDGVIALGGGSSIDVAKSIALLCEQTCSLWDLEDIDDNYQRANSDVIPPVIAIPTTAGTGSEVGRASVIVDEERQTKKIIFHPKMLPSIVVADPELTLALPQYLTAATGMDALAHNVEAFCAPGYHPLADGIAIEGIRLVFDNLVTAVNEGNDLNARSHMLTASMMGATAFQKGLGAIHALSHPLGALYDAHHGLLNAILMPYVLTFNEKAIAEKMALLARVLNLKPFTFTTVLDAILKLREDIAIPHTLNDIHITEEHVDAVIQLAKQDPSCAGNPIPLDEDALRQIFQNAINGVS